MNAKGANCLTVRRGRKKALEAPDVISHRQAQVAPRRAKYNRRFWRPSALRPVKNPDTRHPRGSHRAQFALHGTVACVLGSLQL